MNLILFTEKELRAPLPLSDGRSRHILEILRRSIGETFDIGIIDGPRGKGTVASRDDASLTLSYELFDEPPKPFPVTLLVGLSRPAAMRRVLRDCTSLGVSRLYFFPSDRGEAGYRESTLWKRQEYRRHLIEGAQQAFTTHLPLVKLLPSLAEGLAACDGHAREAHTGGFRAALDNYEAECSLPALLAHGPAGLAGQPGRGTAEPAAVAVGSERGWSAEERNTLRSSGFTLVHLGTRVQRTEIACLSALSILLAELGCYENDPLTFPRKSSQTSS